MKKLIYIAILAAALSSCATQKRCEKKFPRVNSIDSVFIEKIKLDTFKVRIPGDTTIILQPFDCPDQDTVIVENSKQTIKYVVKDRMIYLQSVCKEDSLITVVHSLESALKVSSKSTREVKYTPKFWKFTGWIGIMSIAFLFYLLVKKLKYKK